MLGLGLKKKKKDLYTGIVYMLASLGASLKQVLFSIIVTFQFKCVQIHRHL